MPIQLAHSILGTNKKSHVLGIINSLRQGNTKPNLKERSYYNWVLLLVADILNQDTRSEDTPLVVLEELESEIQTYKDLNNERSLIFFEIAHQAIKDVIRSLIN